jgi:hypothetical protein
MEAQRAHVRAREPSDVHVVAHGMRRVFCDPGEQRS